MSTERCGSVRFERGGHPPAGDRAPELGLGRHVAAGADGVAVGAGDGRRADRQGGVHEPGPGARRDQQLNDDGFGSLYPRYAGGRPPTLTLPQRQQVKKIALSRPMDHGLPLSMWSLTTLAEFLVAEGVVDDISHEGLRDLLRQEGVSFQVIKMFKRSTDPDYEAKKNRGRRARKPKARTLRSLDLPGRHLDHRGNPALRVLVALADHLD